MYSILLSLKSFISIRKKRSALWTLHTYWFILLFFSLWQQHVLAAAKMMGQCIKVTCNVLFPWCPPSIFRFNFSFLGSNLPEVFLFLNQNRSDRCLVPVRLWDPTFTNLHYSAMEYHYLTKQSLADLAI